VWADEEFKKVLSSFKYNHEDAILTINDIKSCKGDAGVTIRKGKKIVSYDYALDLGWTLKLMDIQNKEKVISTCTGRYEMPEVSDQEEVKDWEIRVSV
jgi:activator of HSP90 ATPase